MAHYIHNLDPILFTLGPISVRWYGLMYLTGFSLGYFLLQYRYRRGLFALNGPQTQDLITYILAGMLIGARFVYVLVYNPEILDDGFWKLFAVWEGGLSYHGAAIGFMGAMFLYHKKHGVGFLHLFDNVALGAALGVFFGRFGNFVNGELYGRVTDVPWGVIFPGAGELPRHPSQLYQGICEGLLVFAIMLLIEKREKAKGFAPTKPISDKKKDAQTFTWKRTGVLGSVYGMGYSVFRFIIEFYREPDVQLGYYFGWMTMGQILCVIMFLVATIVLYSCIKKPHAVEYTIE